MPVQYGPDNSPLAFYWAIPPVTRTMATVLLATKLAMSLGVLPLQFIYLHWPSVIWKLQVLCALVFFSLLKGFTRSPAWRDLCFADMEAGDLFCGASRQAIRVSPSDGLDVSCQYLMKLHCVSSISLLEGSSSAKQHRSGCRVQYGKVLESSTFNNNTADFLWMLMFGASAMLVSALISLGLYDAHDASVARSQQCSTHVARRSLPTSRRSTIPPLSGFGMHHHTVITA